jgi:hypothetical protein
MYIDEAGVALPASEIEALENKVNDSWQFSPEDSRIAYIVREPIVNK